MSIQHVTDVQKIARAAQTIGAQLPPHIVAGLDHLNALRTETQAKQSPGALALDLAQHLGNPSAMDKARKAAAQALATAEANAKIDGYLATVCGTRLRGMMRSEGEAIARAFGMPSQTTSPPSTLTHPSCRCSSVPSRPTR